MFSLDYIRGVTTGLLITSCVYWLGKGNAWVALFFGCAACLSVLSMRLNRGS